MTFRSSWPATPCNCFASRCWTASSGLGTGSLRESYDALRAGGARFYVSGMSSKARGFEPNGAAEAALPAKLIELTLDADRVLTY